MNEWNLEDKVSSLTLRNVDICEEVVDSIKDKIKEKKRLPLDSRLFHVKCCAEMFGSMAQDAFEEISIIICKLQELQWSKSECMWDITNFKLKTAFDMESQGEFRGLFDSN
ncbi:zinc finger BED domain-containing protein RICES [Forsythia ovata]|uniref:Zinc finger BED domain-containing protein RICES n=1 Tax=Forsythia ovata TaxID=205694 RepID=A0ABD1WQH2_9LAMI